MMFLLIHRLRENLDHFRHLVHLEDALNEKIRAEKGKYITNLPRVWIRMTEFMEPDLYQDLAGKTDFVIDQAGDFLIDIINRADCQVDMREPLNMLSLMYLAGKLNGEAGEIAEYVFKAFRDDKGVISEERKAALAKELGDVQWYIARIADTLGFKLSDIMAMNIDKLKDRQDRGVLGGSGDER